MSDNKNKQGRQDDIRIDVNDPSELQYVADKFKVSINEVRLAIQKADTDLRSEIYAMLENRPA